MNVKNNNERPAQTDKRVRIPAELAEALEKRAREHCRSLTGEAVFILREAMSGSARAA